MTSKRFWLGNGSMTADETDSYDVIKNRMASECTRIVPHHVYRNFTRIPRQMSSCKRRAKRMGSHRTQPAASLKNQLQELSDITEETFNALYLPENISACNECQRRSDSDVGSFYCVTVDPDYTPTQTILHFFPEHVFRTFMA